VLLLVPSLARAERANAAPAATAAPITAAVWTPDRGRSPLRLIDELALPSPRRSHLSDQKGGPVSE
jgi:hypothetical protein